MVKEKSKKKKSNLKNKSEKINLKKTPKFNLDSEHEIALDFATKVYKKFNKVIKSIVLFGSVAKKQVTTGSDLDIVIIVDDASASWDQEAIAWYREELGKIIKANPYPYELHINTITLTTWWADLIRGDPALLNIIRYGESLLDFGGFFEPLKILLLQGKIKATPEAIYTCLQRAPMHIASSRRAELSSIEGLYWSMVDAAHAALIAINIQPASPEHIALDLHEAFVTTGKLKDKYIQWYRDLLVLHKDIMHGRIVNLKGTEIDIWQERSKEFLKAMIQIVEDIIR